MTATREAPVVTAAPGGIDIGPLLPSTGRLFAVTSWPLASTCRLPARVYASEPSAVCTESQPGPWMATSSGLPVCWIGPGV